MHACAADVDRHLEVRVRIFGDLAAGDCHGLTEAGGRALGCKRRLEHDQIFELEASAQRSRIVRDQGRKLYRLQPEADKGMPFQAHPGR